MRTRVRGERAIKQRLRELEDLRDEVWEELKEAGSESKLANIHLYNIAGLEELIKQLEWVLKLR